MAAALGEFERRNGVAVFLFRSGHPIPYRRHALIGLVFVAHDRIRRETLRRRLGCARICNLHVTFKLSLEAEQTWLFSFVRVAHLHRRNGLNCAGEKMSLELPNDKNTQKSKVLTFE